jgi:alanyl-tRNA synthetase
MVMTEKLYEADAMLKECTATVAESVALKEGFGIVLDKTVLFPEGGGQLSDKGSLVVDDKTTLPVTYVEETKDGRILHYTAKELPAGTKVQVKLDWTVRLDHMQQHTGEHILSYAFWKLFQANNIGFHMSEGLVTIDLDKEVTLEQAYKAEDFANQEIWANKPINISYMPHTEVAKLTMRKKNTKLTGMLRIVAVKDGDICTCCGTHPPFTGTIGLIKITKIEKHKEGTRVEFLCGRWALEDVRKKVHYITDASNMMSTKEENVCAGISKFKEEITALRESLRQKTQLLQASELEELLKNPPVSAKGNKILFVVEDNYDPKSAKSLYQKLTAQEKTVTAVIYKNGERVNYMFGLGAGATGDCKQYIAKANELFGGKGGGKPDSAQGGAAISADWQAKAKSLKEYMLKE